MTDSLYLTFYTWVVLYVFRSGQKSTTQGLLSELAEV